MKTIIPTLSNVVSKGRISKSSAPTFNASAAKPAIQRNIENILKSKNGNPLNPTTWKLV